MKLLLADDHTLFREVMVQYIERSYSDAVVVLAKDFHEALSLMQASSDYDLVLLDLRMPGMDGLEGLGSMRAQYPEVPVALMSGVADPEDVDQAMTLGAAGYFPKTLSGVALLKGIECVLSGQTFVPTDHGADIIMPAYYTDGQQDGLSTSNLTNREKDVLHYLARGDSNKEIARALELQVVTIKLHVRSICQKFDVKNRTQAALKAHALGFVP